MMISTPIVLFIYKRTKNLDALCQVLEEVKPKNVYIIADGPKNPQESKLVKETRAKLESLIAWPCQLRKNYSKTNLGLKVRFQNGIDWVFKSEGRAIFLEDDCIPDPTFFKFCDQLLEKYKDDERIFSISGNNFLFSNKRSKESYYFSKYPHIWGWATWKRSWDKYDSDIVDWQSRRGTSWLREATGGFIISKFWKYIFDRLSAGKVNTWDYQFTYASLKYHGLNIIPSVNLVSNVGYGNEATNIKKHTKTIGIPTQKMDFPLVHPKKITINEIADQQINNLVYLHPLGKVSLFVKSILGWL